MRDLPSGTVSFLFTDVEGSTRLLHELGAEGYAAALAEHRRILRQAFAVHGGVEVDTQGDAFFVAFPTAPGALRAAAEALAGLARGPIRVRMGIHTGTPFLAEAGYVGADVNRAARIAASGHGGQVLVSSSTASLVGTEGLRDLGEHRLKDLSAPERIYQLGEADFPPLASLHQTNLPVPATAFLGRESEVSDIAELLGRDDVRLVTLTGPGGSGKTRLALQSAGAAADAFPGGVWWVPLAALRDPALVLETAAQALGATVELAQHIGDRRLLLLLDNFEQVVAAAPELAGLLRHCPGLALLLTSREPLHLDGEWEYAVDPLREAEAVALFETRARAARRDFAADGEVRAICARLDNLPLAIELAAARVKVLSPAALLQRLEQRLPVLTSGGRDAPERQRTLRATIEWSHDLLTEEEQTLFRRLGVFAGGCTLESAEQVADADLDTLASLVDKSLLRQTHDRFWMLETIRDYATDQLEASDGPNQLRGHHAEHYLTLIEEAEPHLLRGAGSWTTRVEREHDNLRAALDWLEASGENHLALRLVGALARFWYQTAHVLEGRRRVEAALRMDAGATAARARALTGAAMLAHLAGDLVTMKARVEEAYDISIALEDAWGSAYSRFLFGHTFIGDDEFARSREVYEESVAAFRELGDEHFTLVASRALAWMCEELGDQDRFRALYEDILSRARTLGNKRMEARGLCVMARFEAEEGRLGEGLAMLHEAYRIDRDGGLRLEVAVDLSRFAELLAAERPEAAAQLLSKAETLRDELGASSEQWAAKMNEQTLATVRSRLDETAFAEAWAQGRELTPDEAVALALET